MNKAIILVVGLACAGLLSYSFFDRSEQPREPTQARNSGGQNYEASDMHAKVAYASSGPAIPAASTPAMSPTAPASTRSPYWKEALAQGFAIYVNNALRGGDPKLALGAYRLLQSCQGIDAEVSALQERLQSVPSASSDYKFLLAELTSRQAEQRQCQSISSEMRGNSRNLLEQAARGGLGGAASAYVRAFTAPVPLKENDAWLVPLLVDDADKGDLSSIYDLACDSRRQLLHESGRQFYMAALKWAATNSPEADRAKRWLQACAPNGSAADAVHVPEEMQANIVNAARRRLSGQE